MNEPEHVKKGGQQSHPSPAVSGRGEAGPGDFDQLKAKAWQLVENAERLLCDAKSYEDRKGALHAAKQVFELYGTLLDKYERGAEVADLRKRLDALQATLGVGLRKAIPSRAA